MMKKEKLLRRIKSLLTHHLLNALKIKSHIFDFKNKTKLDR